ncbi:MAG: M16 family metallopeptidase, partial [Rhodothermia bacterium]
MKAEHDAFEFLEAHGGIAHYRHRENGLQVLLLVDRATPVAAFMVSYHVGSRNEAPGTTGATHLLEHLMFKGSERFNKRDGTDVFEILQEVGAQVNASTWLDRTNYYEVLPAEHLGLAVEIEADRMRHALISDEDLASERVVVLNELDRGQNSPLRNLHDSVWSTAFQAHPYGHPTIGWRSDVETVTSAGLKSYYDTFYWPGNATVSVIGNVEPAAVLGLVDQHFGGIPERGDQWPEVTTVEPEQRGERRVTLKQAGQLGTVIRAYKMPDALDPDTDALHVLARILTGGMSSRAYRQITDRGLTTTVSANASRLRYPGLFQLWAMLAEGIGHDTVDDALGALISEVCDSGVEADELNRAKAKTKADEAFGRDGPYMVAAQLNEAIAAGDWKLFAEFAERIDRVTA